MYENTFENKIVGNGTLFYSRIIASWHNAGGVIYSGCENRITGENWRFIRWLESLGFLTEEQIRDIRHMAEDGKLELEDNARRFLKENPINTR